MEINSGKKKNKRVVLHMAERKTSEQKLAELDKKLAQLQEQKKAILQREKQVERKARTKRLIEVGAAVEAALGYALDTEEMRSALMDFLKQQEQRGNFVSKAVKIKLSAVPKSEQSWRLPQQGSIKETVRGLLFSPWVT